MPVSNQNLKKKHHPLPHNKNSALNQKLKKKTSYLAVINRSQIGFVIVIEFLFPLFCTESLNFSYLPFIRESSGTHESRRRRSDVIQAVSRDWTPALKKIEHRYRYFRQTKYPSITPFSWRNAIIASKRSYQIIFTFQGRKKKTVCCGSRFP